MDGVEWESLKRYNINELYRLVAAKSEEPKQTEEAEKAAEEVKSEQPAS